MSDQMNAMDLLAALSDIVARNATDQRHSADYKKGMADLLRLGQTMFGESMLTKSEKRENERFEKWAEYRDEAQHAAMLEAERNAQQDDDDNQEETGDGE